MSPLNGWDGTLPADALLDSGVLYVGSTPVGVSRGGLSFDPGRQTRSIAFDGKRSDVKGLDRVTGWDSKISGTLLEFAGGDIQRLEPGSTSAVVGGTTTYTPKGAGALFASGDYLADVRLIFERSGGGYAAVYFPSAFVDKWGPLKGSDNNEAEMQIQISARAVVAAAADVPKCPYAIEIRTALP